MINIGDSRTPLETCRSRMAGEIRAYIQGAPRGHVSR